MTVPTHKNSTQTSLLMKGAVCLGVSFTLLRICRGKLHCWACIFAPDDKSSVSPLWKLKSSNLKTARKTLWIIYITIKTLVELLSFWKKQAACHPLLGIYQTSQVLSIIRVTTGTAVNTQRTLSRNISSHGSEQCVLSVSLTLLETSGKSLLWSWVLCLMAKAFLFSPWESKKFATSDSRRTLCFIYLFIKVKNLVN